MHPIIRKYFGESNCYLKLRSMWYAHLREVPRRRLQRHGAAALRCVCETLNGTAAQYFVDYGTLLGITRDHNFIRHDDDIDITVIAGSIPPAKLFETLESNRRLKFSHAFEFRGRITEMTFLYKGIEIDFFISYVQHGGMMSFIYQPEDGQYALTFGRQWGALCITRSIVPSIDTVSFKGSNIPVPCNVKELLRDTYGTWETPLEGWNEAMDCGQRPYLKVKGVATIVDGKRVAEIGKNSAASI